MPKGKPVLQYLTDTMFVNWLWWNWKLFRDFDLRMRQVSLGFLLSLLVFRTSAERNVLCEERLGRQKCWINMKQHDILLLNSCFGSKSLLHLLKVCGGNYYYAIILHSLRLKPQLLKSTVIHIRFYILFSQYSHKTLTWNWDTKTFMKW